MQIKKMLTLHCWYALVCKFLHNHIFYLVNGKLVQWVNETCAYINGKSIFGMTTYSSMQHELLLRALHSSPALVKDIQSSSMDIDFLLLCSLSRWPYTALVTLRFRLWGGQSTTDCAPLCVFLSIYPCFTAVAMCLKSLPSWWIKIWPYCSAFIIKSILIRSPKTLIEIQPQTMTGPQPWFRDGCRHSPLSSPDSNL